MEILLCYNIDNKTLSVYCRRLILSSPRTDLYGEYIKFIFKITIVETEEQI